MEPNKFQNDPRELIQLAKSGDQSAFGTLYNIYFTPVFRYIYLRVHHKETAEDLVHEVFIKVLNSLGTFKPKAESPLSYFFTIARNTVIDYTRKKKEVFPCDFEKIIATFKDDSDNPLDIAKKNDAKKVVYDAMGKLSPDQQEVIILKFINGFSNDEIAQLMSKKNDAVRQLQCRALASLRNILKENSIA